jgi:hypothetical protein
MADVEPVEAETMSGEMWADKKATLLAVVQANNDMLFVFEFSILQLL